MKYNKKAIDVIRDESLTFHQQIVELYKIGENTDRTIPLTKDYERAIRKGIICDLNEGMAPFRPRYNLPDYTLLFKNGCEFLGLSVPTTIWEATSYLLILYANVPTGSTYPVYLGSIDTLLEPFVKDRDEAKQAIRLFLLAIDKTMPDSFVHANIGPTDTLAGRLILECTQEMQLAVPNLTIKYDEDVTPDEFAELCVKCMLKTSKPSFANDKMFKADLGDNYGIASCYNGFRVTGGAYTMNRLRLSDVAKEAKSMDDFFERVLPFYCNLMIDNIENRIKFEVEQAAFFRSSFLVKEGFLKRENFIGMFGLAGLAECVNRLMKIKDKAKGYGHNEEADALGERVIQEIVACTEKRKVSYSENFGDKVLLHAQVGIDSDGIDCSPGVRIPVGYEPEVLDQLMHSTRLQKYFPTGVGDVYKFDETWAKQPGAVLDIIKGGFKKGVRYFSGYEDGGDVVRVTGYLVKRSDLEKLKQGEVTLNQCNILGVGAADNGHALDRKKNHLNK